MPNVYDLEKDRQYTIGEASPSRSAAVGTLTIDGAVRESGEHELFPAYEVTDGNATFTYTFGEIKMNANICVLSIWLLVRVRVVEKVLFITMCMPLEEILKNWLN